MEERGKIMKKCDAIGLMISEKGIAVLAAIEAGLVHPTGNGHATDNFEQFWSLYQESLAKHRLKEVNYLCDVLQQERYDRAGDRTYYRKKYLLSAVKFTIGFILGSLATLLFQFLQ